AHRAISSAVFPMPCQTPAAPSTASRRSSSSWGIEGAPVFRPASSASPRLLPLRAGEPPDAVLLFLPVQFHLVQTIRRTVGRKRDDRLDGGAHPGILAEDGDGVVFDDLK